MTKRIRSATSSGPTSKDSPSTRTKNSSPPSRPTVSLSRRAPVSRSATATEQAIAELMAEGVVDILEVVQIDVERSHGARRSCRTAQHLLGPVEEQRPVRQSGQGVVERLVAQLSGALGHQGEGPLTRPGHVEQEEKEDHAQGAADGTRARCPGGCPAALAGPLITTIGRRIGQDRRGVGEAAVR